MLPQTSQEYFKQVEEKLNWAERTIDNLTGVDERLDITNLLLIEIARLMEKEITFQIPSDDKDQAAVIQGWPSNVPTGRIVTVTIGAENTAYQLPDIRVPSGFTPILKAWPDNANYLYIGFSQPDCLTDNFSYPLLPGDFVGWQIQNTNVCYVRGASPGDRLCITVEQKGEG